MNGKSQNALFHCQKVIGKRHAIISDGAKFPNVCESQSNGGRILALNKLQMAKMKGADIDQLVVLHD